MLRWCYNGEEALLYKIDNGEVIAEIDLKNNTTKISLNDSMNTKLYTKRFVSYESAKEYIETSLKRLFPKLEFMQ